MKGVPDANLHPIAIGFNLESGHLYTMLLDIALTLDRLNTVYY